MNVDGPDMNEVGPEMDEQETQELHDDLRLACEDNGLDSTGTVDNLLDRLDRLQKTGGRSGR